MGLDLRHPVRSPWEGRGDGEFDPTKELPCSTPITSGSRFRRRISRRTTIGCWGLTSSSPTPMWSTPPPTSKWRSFNRDLLAQTENFFVAHLEGPAGVNMQAISRLEDLRSDWQARCAPRIEDAVRSAEPE